VLRGNSAPAGIPFYSAGFTAGNADSAFVEKTPLAIYAK
jgi:hypothetical protein